MRTLILVGLGYNLAGIEGCLQERLKARVLQLVWGSLLSIQGVDRIQGDRPHVQINKRVM